MIRVRAGGPVRSGVEDAVGGAYRPAAEGQDRGAGRVDGDELGQRGIGVVEKEMPMEQPDFEKCGGLVPAIAQDAETGEVLMLAYMNEAAWAETLRTSEAHYYNAVDRKSVV